MLQSAFSALGTRKVTLILQTSTWSLSKLVYTWTLPARDTPSYMCTVHGRTLQLNAHICTMYAHVYVSLLYIYRCLYLQEKVPAEYLWHLSAPHNISSELWNTSLIWMLRCTTLLYFSRKVILCATKGLKIKQCKLKSSGLERKERERERQRASESAREWFAD